MYIHWIHCVENIFTVQDFWAIWACMKNRFPVNFHCIEYISCHSGFLSNSALVLKTEFALKIFTVLNICFAFRIFEPFVFALKNRVCPEFTVLNIYFLCFRILNNLRLPWKTECALKNRDCLENFHCIEMCLIYHDVLAIWAFSENRVCPEMFKPEGGGCRPPTPCFVRQWVVVSL